MKNPADALIARVRGLSVIWRGVLLMVAAVLCLMVFGRMNRRATLQVAGTSERYQQPQPGENEQELNPKVLIDDEKQEDWADSLAKKEAVTREEFQRQAAGLPALPSRIANPLIAHSAELTVATKEFAQARSSLEEILERHRGYAAKLRMVGQRSGSVLNATLRVPSTELGATVSELKSLGDVEREEQAADEITQQHADLEARLSNAQNTLRRLQELLKKQTYPDGNVRELQRQIANANAEVNRLEAERQGSDHKVVFANVRFSLREDLSAPAESFGAQLRGAVAAGFGDAAASISALLVFLIGRGPVLIMWSAILFFPARLIWKKWQPATSVTTVQGA